MAALMPTVDAVMRPAFGRPKIMEALELFGVRAAPRQGAKALKEQLLQLIQNQAPGRVVGDGMVVDGAPAHAPAAAAGTAPGAKPSTASEGLLARLAKSGGAFTADDITFSVRTMLDENAHALPGFLAALKSIAKEIGVVREGLARSERAPDKLHHTIKACPGHGRKRAQGQTRVTAAFCTLERGGKACYLCFLLQHQNQKKVY